MLKTKNPLLLIPFKYGLLGGAMNILALLVLFYLGRHPLLLNPVLDARIPLFLLFIFISIKVFKDQAANGEMHFWQGMTLGMLAYFLISLITATFIFVFSEIESTRFLSEYVRIASSQLTLNKQFFIESIGEKTFSETLAQLPKTKGIHLAFDYLLKSMPIGLFLTIIMSILLRNKVSTNLK